MSEEAEKSPLLEAEEMDASDFLIPAVLGLAGAAVLYKATKKKKGEAAPLPESDDDEVAFAADFSGYKIGSNWEEMVLEPYLAEQAEDGSLVVASDELNMGPEGVQTRMKDTRQVVLNTFIKTHRVKVPKGTKLISELPDKPKVQEFLERIKKATIEFQETY